MANTVLSSLVAEAVFRVSPDKTSDSAFAARVLTRINWAMRDIAELKEPAEFEVMDESTLIVDSVSSYLLPDNSTVGDVLKLKTVTILGIGTTRNPIILRPMLRREYDRADILTTGIPSRFFHHNAFVYLVPTPNASVASRYMRFQYIKTPETVTDETSECVLPPRWDEALICGAAMKYFRDDGQFERASAAEKDYRTALGIRRSKKANQFAASGGRGIGVGHSGSGYRGYR